MVFVSADGGFEKTFKQIRKQCSSAASVARGISLLIVVPLEVDALCACRTLAALLAADYVPFKILPIRGLEDILRINEVYLQAAGSEGSRQEQSIFFINCAGSIDISSLLSLSPSTTAYVIDSHRPIHLANIFDNSQVVVFDDGDIEANYALLKDLFLLSEADSEGEAESEGEGESENENENENEGESENESSSQEESSTESDSDATSPSATTSHDSLSLSQAQAQNTDNLSLVPTQLSQEPQKQHSPHSPQTQTSCTTKTKQDLREYYQTKFHGSSAASLLYALCSSLGKENNEHLWNAILGTTEQLHFHRISPAQYEETVELLKEEAIRMNPPASCSTASEEVQLLQEGRITFLPNEYKFFSHRHWNLYESMKHSEYIATRLGIWKEKGIQRLDLILAKMAIPIREACQDFGHFSFSHKSTLFDQISRVLPEWGLDQVTFPSFSRTLCYGFEASSSDIVSCTISWMQMRQEENATSGAWYSSFFNAYKLLEFSTRNLQSIQRGIQLSIANQCKLVKQVSILLSRSLVKQFKYFRFAVVKEVEFDPFSTHILGNWLATALEVGGKPRMPILIAALQSVPSKHYRVGFVCENDFCGMESVSGVHARLKSVALEMRLEVEVDGADWGCQAIVPVEQLMGFVHKVVNVMTTIV